jgi:hypothetical protein
MVSTSGYAFTSSKPVDLPQKTSPVISVKIDLGDITNLNENDIAALINKNLVISLPDLPVLQCAITIEATFDIGVMSFRVSVTISGDCSEVRSRGKALAMQIIDEVKNYIEDYF